VPKKKPLDTNQNLMKKVKGRKEILNIEFETNNSNQISEWMPWKSKREILMTTMG
jgi:hypothetical protein